MRGFRMVESCSRLSRAARLVQFTRPLCTNTNNDKAIAAKSVRDDDAYRQLEKLDFMTAAKILFTDPPKKKKFGLDFHLVQLFFACMPSLAVYLVAQYARYEIRRMEAEVELKKKKAEEEEKAKEMEANALKESEEAESDRELLNIKVRLDALEEVVKEVVVESKKLSEGSNQEKVETFRSNSESKSQNSSSEADDQQSKKQPSESKWEPSQETVSGSGSGSGSGSQRGGEAEKNSPKN